MKRFGAKKIAALTMALAIVTVGGVYATWTYTSSTAGDSFTSNITVSLTGSKTEGTSSLGSYSVDKSVTTIYKLDQYSDAIDHLYSNTSTDSDYDYIIMPVWYDSGLVCDYIAISACSGGSLTYYEVTSTGLSASSSSVSSNVYEDYTAALCILHGSYITISFTTTDDTYKDTGVDTTFSFSWNEGKYPTLYATVDSEGNYYYTDSASGGVETEVFDLNTDAQYIYNTNHTGVSKNWTKSSDYNFYYTIDAEELISYMCTEYRFVLSTLTAYNAMNTALSGLQINLTVTEAGSTMLTTPSISVTITDGSYTITDTNTSTNVSGYYVGLFSATADATPVYYFTTTNISGDLDDIITKAEADTYYIRIRAVSSDSTAYSNSAWSDIACTATVATSSGTITGITYTAYSV